MDRSEFHALEAGKVVATADGYAAFVPAPLPPRLRYGRDLVLALSRADAALGELSGVGSELPDPELLVAPFLRQEALCSSRIEGSLVTLPELLLDDVGAAPPTADREHLREVRNCFAALQYGVERLGQVPLSLALLREIHEQLLRGELGTTRRPGEFRAIQNWLGPPGATLAHATYVPPPVPEMQQALAAWESFLADRASVPDLVQCAMVHEQFEAIHPFVGGNGRIGRILIPLFLIERGRLSHPLLFLSAWFEGRREEYYRSLQRVRTHGEWEPWLRFFVTGVAETAERAIVQARLLLSLRNEFRTQVKGQVAELADELFRYPCITIPEVERALSVTPSVARRTARALEDVGIVTRLDEDHGPLVYVARTIVDALRRPLDELRPPPHVETPGEVLKSGPGTGRALERPGDLLMAEAMRMIDEGREAGVSLRLTGGLAVRRHCTDLEFADREYSDIDFVALSDQIPELGRLFASLGFTENRYVAQSTGSNQLQFLPREALRARARGGEPSGPPPLVDHVDVFMDVMRMDHDIDVRGRLDIDDYAISPVDTLIAKLQIGRINQKDVHDAIALVKDMPLRESDDDLSIFVTRFAEVCAADWGLYRDITTNLELVLERVRDYGLPDNELARVTGRFVTLKEAVEEASKTFRWRLRSAVGERVAWRREVDETEGTPVIAPEWDWRRDLG